MLTRKQLLQFNRQATMKYNVHKNYTDFYGRDQA